MNARSAFNFFKVKLPMNDKEEILLAKNESSVQEKGLAKYFEFGKFGTSYRTELIAGITTFLAMAYILAVNPDTLAAAGMDKGAVFTATALAAIIGTLVMGLYAKYPVALAPGMGLNAFFAFTVVLGMDLPWEQALAGVFVSGILFLILAISGIRETIINAIPEGLKHAVGAGIGLFIAFIGLKNAGIIVSNDATFVALGKFTEPSVLLALFGIVVTILLLARKINAAVFYGMLITTAVGIIFQIIDLPKSIVDLPPNPSALGALFGPLFDFSAMFSGTMLIVILTFLFVDFFDTAGTLMGVATQAGFIKDNKLPRAGRALTADSIATIAGAVAGTSTTTSYIESSAGIGAGGRTGFTAVVTAGLFVIALFFFPIFSVITSAVTSAALVVVGILMATSLGKIAWDKVDEAAPAFVTIIAMPLTFSIATGIALGFILYPLAKLVKGEGKKVHWIMYVMLVVFIIYFAFLRE
jgi:AGZA family xanthine/uracil permease-like MFS transporter